MHGLYDDLYDPFGDDFGILGVNARGGVTLQAGVTGGGRGGMTGQAKKAPAKPPPPPPMAQNFPIPPIATARAASPPRKMPSLRTAPKRNPVTEVVTLEVIPSQQQKLLGPILLRVFGVLLLGVAGYGGYRMLRGRR